MVEHCDIAFAIGIAATNELAMVAKLPHGEILAFRQQLKGMEKVVACLHDKPLVRIYGNAHKERERIVAVVANPGILDAAVAENLANDMIYELVCLLCKFLHFCSPDYRF